MKTTKILAAMTLILLVFSLVACGTTGDGNSVREQCSLGKGVYVGKQGFDHD